MRQRREAVLRQQEEAAWATVQDVLDKREAGDELSEDEQLRLDEVQARPPLRSPSPCTSSSCTSPTSPTTTSSSSTWHCDCRRG